MNKELKVVNLLHKWMLMALVLTMPPMRTPSTLVIIEAMAITMDDLVVHKVERRTESVQEQTDLSLSRSRSYANANSANTSSTTYTNPQAYMAAPSSGDPNNNSWFLDNGATHHITTHSSNLASKNDYNGKENLVIGNGSKLRLLRNALVSWGFQPSIYDNSLFYSRKNGHLVLVLVYVDDILIIGGIRTHSLRDSTLTSWFALKTLGFISYFLRFEAKYISDLLVKTNMVHVKPSSTPMALGRNLLLKMLIFLMSPCITPSLSQILKAPTQHHWSACKRLLCYVSGARTLGLSF
ncbi:hypothetical protein AAG906_006654 [Vitis piasezkii]